MMNNVYCLDNLNELKLYIKSLNNYSIIYKIKNIINEKIYIGKTKNILNRIRQYKYYFKSKKCPNKHLISSIEKYGLKNFEIMILEFVNENNINNREKYWIDFFNSHNPEKGYNKTLGGEGLIATEEIKMKISNSLKNIKHTEERKKNQSLSHIGHKNTREQNIKIGISNKNRKKDLDEHKKLRKIVIQYDLQYNFIKEWMSVADVQRNLGINKGSISKCCNHKSYKSAGGYIWKYK